MTTLRASGEFPNPHPASNDPLWHSPGGLTNGTGPPGLLLSILAGISRHDGCTGRCDSAATRSVETLTSLSRWSCSFSFLGIDSGAKM